MSSFCYDAQQRSKCCADFSVLTFNGVRGTWLECTLMTCRTSVLSVCLYVGVCVSESTLVYFSVCMWYCIFASVFLPVTIYVGKNFKKVLSMTLTLAIFTYRGQKGQFLLKRKWFYKNSVKNKKPPENIKKNSNNWNIRPWLVDTEWHFG